MCVVVSGDRVKVTGRNVLVYHIPKTDSKKGVDTNGRAHTQHIHV